MEKRSSDSERETVEAASIGAPGDRARSGGTASRTLRGSLFELTGYGTQQVLRLASNIVLSRILFPEAFGLASMVSVLLTGLTMLSDMGIQQFLIQNPRGEDPDVYNTAFTFQAVRGLILFSAMLFLARPAAWFFKEDRLVPLLYLGSIQLAAMGLRSTSVITLRRKLTLGWITILELGQSVLTLAIMIPWAVLRPSVFPLIAGASISSCAYAAATHLLPVGYRNRFHWNKAAYSEMSRFGRWIFGSSAVAFLGAQVDRLFYGRYIGMAWLGVYSIALNLSEAISALINRLVGGIVYPLLSDVSRTDQSRMSSSYYSLRLRLDAFAMGGTGLLAGAGGWIIRSLWDQRYSDATWILRILCVKVALTTVIGLGETCLFAMGHTRYGFWKSVCRFVSIAVGLPLGWHVGGVLGVLWVSVLAEAPAALIIWPKLRRLKILRLHRELLSVALFLIAFGAGSLLLPWLPEIYVRR